MTRQPDAIDVAIARMAARDLRRRFEAELRRDLEAHRARALAAERLRLELQPGGRR
jgi:hypothetical protein